MAEEAHYESEYFLTLTYLPPVEIEQKAQGFMFEGGEIHQRLHGGANTGTFPVPARTIRECIWDSVQDGTAGAVQTEDDLGGAHVQDRLLRYVRRCISGDDHPFAVPEIPVFLNDVLACDDFGGGVEPRIGQKHIRILAIDGFPRSSSPGLLRELDSLSLEYRWNTRAVMLDRERAEAILDKTRKKWRSKIRGWRDQILKTETGAVNLYAAEMASDAERAMSVASSGDVQFAWYSSNIVCMDDDPKRLHQTVRTIMKTLQHLGFSCRIETVNAVEAWRGSLPGDGYRNVRRNLLHTLNIADLLPITAVWAGQRENPSALMPRKSPPLLYAATNGSTPFRFNLHVSDLGHTMICGPSGAGKSTLLGLLAAQWFRYPGAQVFAFDRGYSLYVLTQAAGGEFYDLAGPGNRSCVLPSPAHRFRFGPYLGCGLDRGTVQTQRPGDQSFAEKPHRAWSRKSPYLPYSFFDRVADQHSGRGRPGSAAALHLGRAAGTTPGRRIRRIGNRRFLTFETEHLLQLDEKAVLPVLLYLFRQIEKRLDGSPTLVLLDEAWSYFKHDLFRERMRDWLKTMRKLNGVVVMATQQLSDILGSGISDVILEACPTKILLPNAESKSPYCGHSMNWSGLIERELDILQTSIPKQHYYVVSPLGRRLVDLGVGNVALSFVGVNGPEERPFDGTNQGTVWGHMAGRVAPLSRSPAIGRITSIVSLTEFEGGAKCAKAS